MVKGKVNLSLCLTDYHASKTSWENGGIATSILAISFSKVHLNNVNNNSVNSTGV